MKNNTPYVSGDTYISNEDALHIYQMMGYSFDKEEFIKGMNVELEHQDVTDGSLVKTAMIAAAHLREVPNYYTLLLKYVEPKNEQLVGPDGSINGAPTPARVKKMKKSQLQELIQEVLDEVMNEAQLNEADPVTIAATLGAVGLGALGAKRAAKAPALDYAQGIGKAAKNYVKNAVLGTNRSKKPSSTATNKLKEYIREVLDEMMNEGQLEVSEDFGNNPLVRKAGQNRLLRKIIPGLGSNEAEQRRKDRQADVTAHKWSKEHGHYATSDSRRKAPPKEMYRKGVKRTEMTPLEKDGPSMTIQHTDGGSHTITPQRKTGVHIRGHHTDKLQRSANRYNQIAKKWNLKKPTNENTMPTLQEILMEGKENRVLLTKLTVLMEKMQPDFTKAQATKMMELCSETHQLVNTLNTLPYTIHNHMEWKLLKMGLVQKLMEVKAEAEKINSDKLNTTTFIKALDEIIVQ